MTRHHVHFKKRCVAALLSSVYKYRLNHHASVHMLSKHTAGVHRTCLMQCGKAIASHSSPSHQSSPYAIQAYSQALWSLSHADIVTDVPAGAYKKALMQQVAAAMHSRRRGSNDQENHTPEATSLHNCQAALLQLVPPTPAGTAPMQAAAVSVAAKGQQAVLGKWIAPVPAEGILSILLTRPIVLTPDAHCLCSCAE